MNLSEDNRRHLREGLDWSIAIKENEILSIREKSEEDYKLTFNMNQFRKVPLTLEQMKEQDVQKVKDEIDEIRKLRELLNSNRNHVLIVSSDIKLALTTTN